MIFTSGRVNNIFLLQVKKEQIRFIKSGRRRVVWPDIIEHDGVFITMPPEWYIEAPKHCARRVSQVQQFFSEGRGLSEPVVYMNQKFQVIDGEFKVVSYLADIICLLFCFIIIFIFFYIYIYIFCTNLHTRMFFYIFV